MNYEVDKLNHTSALLAEGMTTNGLEFASTALNTIRARAVPSHPERAAVFKGSIHIATCFQGQLAILPGQGQALFSGLYTSSGIRRKQSRCALEYRTGLLPSLHVGRLAIGNVPWLTSPFLPQLCIKYRMGRIQPLAFMRPFASREISPVFHILRQLCKKHVRVWFDRAGMSWPHAFYSTAKMMRKKSMLLDFCALILYVDDIFNPRTLFDGYRIH